MKRLLLGTALASLALATAANASQVSFLQYGGAYTPPALRPGATLVTDFASNAGLSGTYTLTNGTSGTAAAPAFSSSLQDPDQYLAIEGGDTATLQLPDALDVEIYVGSLDSYNTISFSNGTSFTGTQLASLTGAIDNGDQWAGTSNGLFTFHFASDVTSVTFASTTDALEVAQVSSGVPEPSTWAMLGLGFAGLGFAAFRRSGKTPVAIA